MELRFYEDPDTAEPHIYQHGVSEDEVRQVLARPAEDRPSSDNSRMALGQTHAGRYLRVRVCSKRGQAPRRIAVSRGKYLVGFGASPLLEQTLIYVPDPAGDSAFVVTAYELRGKQLAAFRRRRRRKGK